MQFVLIDGPMTNNVSGRFMLIYAGWVLPDPGPGETNKNKTHRALPDLWGTHRIDSNTLLDKYREERISMGSQKNI